VYRAVRWPLRLSSRYCTRRFHWKQKINRLVPRYHCSLLSTRYCTELYSMDLGRCLLMGGSRQKYLGRAWPLPSPLPSPSSPSPVPLHFPLSPLPLPFLFSPHIPLPFLKEYPEIQLRDLGERCKLPQRGRI